MLTRINFQWVLTGAVIALVCAGFFSIRSGSHFLLKQSASERVESQSESGQQEFAPFSISNNLVVTTKAEAVVTLESLLTAAPAQWSLLHFWATWCEPCREELKEIKVFRETVKDVRVVQVSADFRWDEVNPFLEKLQLKVGAHDYLDVGGKTAKLLGSMKFPETYLVDPTGVVVTKFVGPQRWNSTEAQQFFAQFVKYKSFEDLKSQTPSAQ